MSADEDWTSDAGERLSRLLEGARRASEIRMSNDESARLRENVRQGRAPRRKIRPWIPALAASLLAAAGVIWWRWPAPAPVEIVKQIRFESVHEEKVVRFEMTVYREPKKEK